MHSNSKFSPFILYGLVLVAALQSCAGSSESVNVTPETISFPVVEFSIPAFVDTTLFGEQGTRIFIEKGTFQFSDGTAVTDSIKIELEEYYSMADIALADLSTQSGDQILETGGMLNIKATSGGREIEIKPDKRIVVHFPKNAYENKNMDLFYLDVDSGGSAMNWTVDTVNLVKKTLTLASYGWWEPGPGDSTTYNFMVKDYVDTGYFWNPIDFYVSSYEFTDATKKEIETTLNTNSYEGFEWWNSNGVECEMKISKDGYIEDPRITTPISKAAKQEIIAFLKNLPQLQPGRNKDGEIIERRGLMFITGGNIVPLYETEEEYVKSFNSKYAAFENSPIRSLDDAELNYYIFSVSELGWINCDRFLEIEDKIDYYVKAPVEKGTTIKLIFNEIDAILAGTPTSDGFVFRNVPRGESVTIFAMQNNDGFFRAAFHGATIEAEPFDQLGFKEMTLAELRKELEQYD